MREEAMSSLPDTLPARSIFQPLRPSEIGTKDDIPLSVIPMPVEADLQMPSDVPSLDDADERPVKRRRVSPAVEDVPSSASSNPSSALVSDPSSHQKSLTPLSLPVLHHGRNTYLYRIQPPTAAELLGSTDQYGIPSKVYRDPYYSKEIDAPEKPREFAGLVFHLKGGDGIANLEEWKTEEIMTSVRGAPPCAPDRTGVGGWEYASTPPSVREVRKWLKEERGRLNARPARKKDTSQVSPS